MKYNTLDFKDYHGKLEGMKVLFIIGGTITTSKYITTITRETNTGFRISKSNNLYDKSTGVAKGKANRYSMGTTNKCLLITTEEANRIIEHYKMLAEVKRLKRLITSELDADEVKTIEQLNKAYRALTKNK